jgi:hypothetical protein
MKRLWLPWASLLLLWWWSTAAPTDAFSLVTPVTTIKTGMSAARKSLLMNQRRHPIIIVNNIEPVAFPFRLSAESDPGTDSSSPPTTKEEESTPTTTIKKMTLEEKMKGWEATEAEMKAASLGGVIPSQNRERTGAFDVVLFIAFPLMVLSGLAFALFPLIVGTLDVDSVGPPPTM